MGTPQALSSYVTKKAENMPPGDTPPPQEDDEFTQKDFETVCVAVATITGVVEDREVFPDVKKMYDNAMQQSNEEDRPRLDVSDAVLFGEFAQITKETKEKSRKLKEDTLERYK